MGLLLEVQRHTSACGLMVYNVQVRRETINSGPHRQRGYSQADSLLNEMLTMMLNHQNALTLEINTWGCTKKDRRKV